MLIVAVLFLAGVCQGMPVTNQLTDYLYQYGYLPASDHDLGVVRAENEIQQALMRLQTFAGLEATGELDGPTEVLMATPRCGVTDKQFGELEAPSNYSARSAWSKSPVTYGYVNYTPDLDRATVVSDIDSAAKQWADASGLQLNKVSSGYSADIPISFGSRYHGSCSYPFDGRSGTLAHAFFPDTGDLHFDEDETWTHASYSGTNLMWVAIHEFGHSLGLGHSEVRSAIMYPYYTGYNPDIKLRDDDIAGIQDLYGLPGGGDGC